MCTQRSAGVRAMGPRTLQGAPMASTPSGMSVPGVTSEPAAIMERAPILAPSSTVDALPTRASSPMVAACTMQRCPMVAPGPTSAPPAGVTWSPAPACALHPPRDHEGGEVGAKHRVVPDGRVFLHRHVPDDAGGGGDEGGGVDLRRLAL